MSDELPPKGKILQIGTAELVDGAWIIQGWVIDLQGEGIGLRFDREGVPIYAGWTPEELAAIAKEHHEQT